MYGYDARGDLIQVQDWLGGITTFSYDAGRLVGIARPNRRTTGYQYGFTAIADRPAMGT